MSSIVARHNGTIKDRCMKKIAISNSDSYALIDDIDYAIVSKYSWRLLIGNSGIRYAYNGAFTMHRLIMQKPEDMMIDHRDRNGLNNRRSNMRLCTNSQNQANAKRRIDNKTGHKGVQIDNYAKQLGRPSIFRASIMHKGKLIRIGRFRTKKEAKMAYDRKALELFGDFARG